MPPARRKIARKGSRTADAVSTSGGDVSSSKSGDALPPFTRTLRFAATAGAPASTRTDALVVYAFEGSREVEGSGGGRLGEDLRRLLDSERFRAKRGRTLLYLSGGRHSARRLIVAGLGRKEDYDLDALREASASSARRACSSSRSIVFAPPPSPRGRNWSAGTKARAIAEGFLLGTYRMRKYLTGEERREGDLLRTGAYLASRHDLAEAKQGVRLATTECEAANLARDLVNEPAMYLTPVRMAEIASSLARTAGLECVIHDRDGIEALGMGAFLGVSRGSAQPPRLIHLTYRPAGTPARKVVLVGKGITFDSGGLSLKTSSSMETMKLDKAGASAVLATMLSLPDLSPPVEVHGLMGMTENMPSGSAVKPGDIVRTAGGKTIEILNTDAEGRLVLADLLTYAKGLGADEIIDVATLTGACMVALGPLAGGLFSNDRSLSDRLLAAADRTGEKLWPLPLIEEYRTQIRSEMADVKNTGERYGGAITAALFLREFVGKRIPWAHLDIAGPSFLESNCHPYMRRGATGAGVRTLLTYLCSLTEPDRSEG